GFCRVGAGAGGPALGGLEAGTTVPEFEAETPDGRRLSRRDLGERRALVLGFFSPTCSACTHHLPDFGTFSKRAQEKGVQAVAVVDGDAAQSEELRSEERRVGRVGRARRSGRQFEQNQRAGRNRAAGVAGGGRTD